jgi:hypothetical protein
MEESTEGKDAIEMVQKSLEEYNIPFESDEKGLEITVSDLANQSFAITIVDDFDESIIFVDEATWHSHFCDAEEAHSVFFNLLDGNLEIETTFRGGKFDSAVLREHNGRWSGHSVGVVFKNPFKKVTKKLFRNQVVVKSNAEHEDKGEGKRW